MNEVKYKNDHADQIAQDAEHHIHDLKQKISHLTEAVSEKSKEVAKLLGEKSRDVAKKGKKVVKEHPVATASVVAALGVGVLLGWLMSRSK